jgi:hypothetical protein
MGIETGLLIASGIGAATGLASMGMGFSQAAAAADAEAKALAASEKLMEEAKKQAEIEYLQKLNIPLDGYDGETRANLQVEQQNILALQEGDSRNLAAGVGRVGAGATDVNEDIRIAKGKDLFDLSKIQAEERQDIGSDLKDMAVGAAADQQQISRDAAEEKAAAQQNAMAGLGQVASSAAGFFPLYAKSKEDKDIGKALEMTKTNSSDDYSAMRTLTKNEYGNTGLYDKAVTANDLPGQEKYKPMVSGVSQMNDSQFRAEVAAMNLTPEQLKYAKLNGFKIVNGRLSI